ncbi:MAG TPA: aminotransferase class I/II-fold pyridoxal phosphate-dependent enzyme [Anaerolineales bacterium]|nr:aminotransferase class I/II-fold pyridoxal phosphate-dependent enzyme [Anaerolineales bacterium]
MKIRAHLESLPPYSPIEPFEVLSARIGREPSQIVKLDANENPYGPLPVVRGALGKLEFPHIYPDPESRALRKALSGFTGIGEEYLLAGAGADELIDLLMRVVLEPGDCILSCPPTFGMYSFDAELNAARGIEVLRRADFSLDMESIRKAIEIYRPKMFFITSPNNPDGSLVDSRTMDELLSLPTFVVLDEAYIEFADPLPSPSSALSRGLIPNDLGASLSRIREVPLRENLVVLRTFSKWAGLAGLRIGYGAFPLWLMPTLWKAKQPYNVNVAASLAAQVSLEHIEELTRIVDLLRTERARLFAALQEIPYLKTYPSQSNFILCQVIGQDAATLKTRLAEDHGVFVRYFNKPALRDHIRISVGRPQDTDALLEALRVF